MVVRFLHGAKQALSLRILPGLNRCTRAQSSRDNVRHAYNITWAPYLQRPPLKPLQTQHSRVLASGRHVAITGQGESEAEAVFHTPVLLSEVLAAFSAVDLKVCSPSNCLLPLPMLLPVLSFSSVTCLSVYRPMLMAR